MAPKVREPVLPTSLESGVLDYIPPAEAPDDRLRIWQDEIRKWDEEIQAWTTGGPELRQWLGENRRRLEILRLDLFSEFHQNDPYLKPQTIETNVLMEDVTDNGLENSGRESIQLFAAVLGTAFCLLIVYSVHRAFRRVGSSNLLGLTSMPRNNAHND